MDISVYTRPQKPKRVQIKKRTGAPELALHEIEAPLEVDSDTECHITPPAIARIMFDYLEALPDCTILEPSAGTGSLLEPLENYFSKVCAIERHIKLFERLNKKYSIKGVEVINGCFLEFAELSGRAFDRIIMNPPFSKAKAHINAALSLLEDGGKLVALVPSTFDMEGFHTIKNLGADTFSMAKVHTKIVVYDNE